MDRKSINIVSATENIILTLIMTATGAVLMVGLFQRGLFFSGDLLPVQAAFFFLFLCWCILKQLQRGAPLLRTPLDWCLLVLLLCYFLSVFAAVDKRTALGEFLSTAMYFSVYLMVFDISSRNRSLLKYFPYILLGSSLLLALTGLGAAAGSWDIYGAYEDNRLQSSLQYPNTAAVYFAAGLFLALGLSSTLKKWYLRLFLLAAGALFVICIFFTYSRGVWLVLPFLGLLFVTVSPREERFRVFLYFFITIVAGLILIFRIALALEAGASGTVWGYAAASLIFAATGGFAAKLFMARFPVRLRLPVCSLLVFLVIFAWTYPVFREMQAFKLMEDPGVALSAESAAEQQPEDATLLRAALRRRFPASVYEGIFSREESVSLRFAHYRDALKIIGDYPLLGTGGGGWEALYTAYQEQAYTARAVHNHYLQVWVEAGVLAFLAFAGIWLFYVLLFFRFITAPEISAEKKKLQVALFIPAAAIGAHSALDFNLSYGVVSLFLYILLALAAGMFWSERNFFRCFSAVSSRRPRLWFAVGMGAGISAAAVLLVVTLSLWAGHKTALFAVSQAEKGQYEEAEASFRKAMVMDPLRGGNYLNMARIYEYLSSREEDEKEASRLRNEALEFAWRAYKLEPNNTQFNLEYGTMLLRRGLVDEGLYYINRLLELHPFRQEHFVQVAAARLSGGEYLLQIGRTERAEELLQSIFELEGAVQRYHGDAAALRPYFEKAALLLSGR